MMKTNTKNTNHIPFELDGILEISVLGDFVFNYAGHPVAADAWQRAHARRLIQLLCSSPKMSATRAQVQDVLWPGFDHPRACNRLHHTIHCIRKALIEIPVRSRPQISVTSENIDFIAPSKTSIDIQKFVQGLDTDCTLADRRLVFLQTSLALFRGELAPGWYGCAEIDTRRSWLAKKRATALREAVNIALELSRPKEALLHARNLAMLLETDGPAHCQYAMILMQTGRPDAALLHCNNILATLRSESKQAAEQLEKTILVIQKASNQTNRANADLPRPDAPDLPAAPSLVSRQCIPAPERELIGYESLLKTCLEQLEDPFCTYLTLLAPPGAGKSLLATTVGYRYQSCLQHGAVFIQCDRMTTAKQLFDAVAREIEPLAGILSTSHDQLIAVIKNKELLIILDGLKPNSELTNFIESVGLKSREIKWITTSWKALYVRAERVLYVDSMQLTNANTQFSLSPAARIIKSRNPYINSLHDSHSLKILDSIALTLDGLQLALVATAALIISVSLGEFANQLKKDPSLVMRFGEGNQRSPSARLANSVQTWFSECNPLARDLIGLLSQSKSWLTRDDIVQLVDSNDNQFVDAFIHRCVSQQFLIRRMQESGSAGKSEFRVAKIAVAALLLSNPANASNTYKQRFENWLLGNRPAFGSPASSSNRFWFDCHIDDLDCAAQRWIITGQLSKLTILCDIYESLWAVERHCSTVLPWLDALGATMSGVKEQSATKLLLSRAKLRIHNGQYTAACDDARHALSRQDGMQNPALTLQANQIIQRYSISFETISPINSNLNQRAIEAGELLLRVGQLAFRKGQLSNALLLFSRSVEVFTFFNLQNGLTKALYYSAKINLCLGKLGLIERYIEQIESCTPQNSSPKCEFMVFQLRSDLLLSNMHFSGAIALANEYISRPGTASISSNRFRAMAVIAWSYYGQGVVTMAEAICKHLIEETKKCQDLRLDLSLKTLFALLLASTGKADSALESICSAVDLIAGGQPLNDTQTDLINIAELAHYLGRDEIAGSILNQIYLQVESNNFAIRPWINQRAELLSEKIKYNRLAPNLPSRAMTAAEVVKEIATGYSMETKNAFLRSSKPTNWTSVDREEDLYSA